MHVVARTLLVSALSLRTFAADVGFVTLGNGSPYPTAVADILATVEGHLRDAGRAPDKYHARVDVCDADACAVTVLSKDMVTDPRETDSIRGCPGDYCATMTYSKKSRTISRVIMWR
jgi:hypothetical protein